MRRAELVLPRESITLVAPFDRGMQFGGSMRATAMAEGLESVGRHLNWLTVRPVRKSKRAKLRNLVTGLPALVAYYSDGIGLRLSGPTLIAHSYLAGSVRATGPTVVDWHNLEWQYLRGLGRERGRGLTKLYLQTQARLMRHFERQLLRRTDTNLFCTDTEMTWARAAAPTAELLLFPHQLPRAVIASVEAVHRDRQRLAARSGGPTVGDLLYIGKLTYPANAISLLDFLRTYWPEIHRRLPRVRLCVVGAIDADLRARVESVAGVYTTGSVPDIGPFLRQASAAVLPFAGEGGASLRVLTFAAAGLPLIVVGSGARGYEGSPFPVCSTPEGSAACIERVIGVREYSQALSSSARAFYETTIIPRDLWLELSDRL